MKRNFSTASRPKRASRARCGAMMILCALVLVILFIAAALAIDIARVHVTRAELRTATDAAARAGAEALGREQNEGRAIQAAIDVAAMNTVAGKPLVLRPQDIELGSHRRSGNGRFQFLPGQQPTSALRVTGRRTDDSAGGAVPMFFGPLFGVTHFQPVASATASRLDRDIALVLDVSGSMMDHGRFQALKNALDVFLRELQRMPQDEYVSLQVYSTKGQKLVSLTTDHRAIRNAFDRQQADGWTAIGEGMELGMDSLENDPNARPFAFKEIIVMTDGNQNRGVDPLVVANEAARQGIVVHTITFSQGANQTLMQEVASRTGGNHLHADNNTQLIQVFREIATQLPVMLIE